MNRLHVGCSAVRWHSLKISKCGSGDLTKPDVHFKCSSAVMFSCKRQFSLWVLRAPQWGDCLPFWYKCRLIWAEIDSYCLNMLLLMQWKWICSYFKELSSKSSINYFVTADNFNLTIYRHVIPTDKLYLWVGTLLFKASGRSDGTEGLHTPTVIML